MTEEQRATDTRELLIRLDERMKGMQLTLAQIQSSIASKVENDQEYKEMTTKVNKMWDLQNKAIGYILAWTTLVSAIVGILIAWLNKVIFK